MSKSCLPHIRKNSNLGKQLGLSKDTSFNTIQEIRELIDSKQTPKTVVFDTTNLTRERIKNDIEPKFQKNTPLNHFKKFIKLNKKQVSGLNKNMIAGRVKSYNKRFGTSHYVPFKQMGQADIFEWSTIDERWNGFNPLQGDLFAQKQSKLPKLSKAALDTIVNNLTQRTGFKGLVISEIEAIEILKNTTKKYNGENAFFYNNMVYLVDGKVSRDTPFHEFAHPIVEALYTQNRELFDLLYSELEVTEEGKEIIDYVNSEYQDNSEDNRKETMVTAIGRLAAVNINPETGKPFISAIKRILTALKNLINKLFKSDIRISDLGPDTKLQTIADILSVGNNKIIIDNSTKETSVNEPLFQKSDPYETNELQEVISSWEERNEKEMPLEMKQTLEKIYTNKNDYVLVTDVDERGHYENLNTNTTFDRATEWIKSNVVGFRNKDYFKFGEDENKYSEYREWGNLIDKIMQSVSNGLTLEETIEEWQEETKKYKAVLSEDVVKQLYENFSEIKNNYKEAVITTQVPFASEFRKVAGTADIVLTFEDGSIRILDVKTSKWSIHSKEFTEDYKVNGEKRASREIKFSAQLGTYRGMALSQGFSFKEEDPTSIIAVKTEKEGTEITQITYEGEKKITPIGEFVNYFIPESINQELEKRASSLIDKILVTLDARKRALVGTSNARNKIYKIEELQKTLAFGEKLKQLSKYIDSIHELMVESKYNTLPKELELKIRDLKQGKITEQQAISDLLHFKTTVETIIQTNSDLRMFYRTYLSNQKGIKGSSLDKLSEIVVETDYVEKLYEDEIIPIIADLLSRNISTDTSTKGYQELKLRKKRLEDEKKKYPNPTVSEKKRLDRMERLLKDFERSVGGELGYNKEMMLEYLTFGAKKDISYLDSKVSNALQSSDPVVGTVANIIKKSFEQVRIKALDVAGLMVKTMNNYGGTSDNVADYNSGFYRKVITYYTDKETKERKSKETASFVSKINWDAFNKAREAFREENINKENYEELNEDWIKANYTKLSMEDSVIKNPITGEVVVIEKGINTLLEEYREDLKNGIISKARYEYLEKVAQENSLISLYEFGTPSPTIYKDDQYESITKNPKKKAYYDSLISTYFKYQKLLPEESALGYILPPIPKTSNDRWREVGSKEWLIYQKQNFGSLMSTDYDIRKKDDIKTVPVLFSGKLDFNEISLDLTTSIATYAEAALKYEAQTKLANFADITLGLIQKTNPQIQDSLGNDYIDKQAEKAGVKNELLKLKRKSFGDNNAAYLLGSFIDMHIYGKHKIASPTVLPLIGNTDLNKVIDNMMSFVSFTTLGGLNWVGGLTNYLNGKAQSLVESRAREYFSEKSWLWAEGKADAYLASNAIQDWASPMNKSLVGQLIDLYNPGQKGFHEMFGKSSQSAFKKLNSTGSWYVAMQMTEGKLALETMLAVMNETRLKTSNGYITLFEAYELDSGGKLKLKDGIKLVGGLIDSNIANKIHSIHVTMNGAYDSLHKTDVERLWWGRALMMYKKYVVPGFKRRYKTFGINQEGGSINEGYYRTFYRSLFYDTKELAKAAAGMESNLTPEEKQNIRRALMEQTLVLISGILIGMMSGDDKDKDKNRIALYLLLKINAELGMYGVAGDPQTLFVPNYKAMWKNVKNPTPLFIPIERGFDMAYQLLHPTEEYKVNSGIWDKGDNKLMVKTAKFFGITGTNWDQENAIKWMQGNYR